MRPVLDQHTKYNHIYVVIYAAESSLVIYSLELSYDSSTALLHTLLTELHNTRSTSDSNESELH